MHQRSDDPTHLYFKLREDLYARIRKDAFERAVRERELCDGCRRRKEQLK
jgi:hypothetical protein